MFSFAICSNIPNPSIVSDHAGTILTLYHELFFLAIAIIFHLFQLLDAGNVIVVVYPVYSHIIYHSIVAVAVHVVSDDVVQPEPVNHLICFFASILPWLNPKTCCTCVGVLITLLLILLAASGHVFSAWISILFDFFIKHYVVKYSRSSCSVRWFQYQLHLHIIEVLRKWFVWIYF